jgi:hypothetical protein
MTLKGLAESQVLPDGRLQMDGAEASSALVYGCIRQVKEGANNFDIVIEDGTSSITVRSYNNNNNAGEKPNVEQLQYSCVFSDFY